jgi:DNA polymerase-3 subunit beta
MKFKQKDLKNILSIVCPLANKNSVLPILNNLLIESKKDNIKFISTDLECVLEYNQLGEYKEDKYLIHSKTLQDYINLITDEDVELNFDKKCSIKSKTNKTNINLQKEDYPMLPNQIGGDEYEININDLKKAISQVMFASSTSDIRIELSGVCFIFGEELILVSSDTMRLAEKKIKIKGKENKVIIPSKTLTLLTNILSKINDETIKIIVNKNNVSFKTKDITLLSNLVNSEFPNYKAIIPEKSITEISVDKQELINSIKTNALFSQDGSINLEINDKLIINTESSQGDNKSEIEIKKTGEDNKVVFNYLYLLEIVENINTKNINIKIIDKKSPVILEPEINENYICILMPLNL